MFGQLLRDSDFKGEATYDKVISLAKQGLDHDDKGYRREFVRFQKAADGTFFAAFEPQYNACLLYTSRCV